MNSYYPKSSQLVTVSPSMGQATSLAETLSLLTETQVIASSSDDATETDMKALLTSEPSPSEERTAVNDNHLWVIVAAWKKRSDMKGDKRSASFLRVFLNFVLSKHNSYLITCKQSRKIVQSGC